MAIYIRPSKTFVFEILKRTLRPLQGEIGLDGGSANFKNRHMFQTKKYYGIDIDRERLINGLRSSSRKDAFGIHADLAHLEKLPSCSADVVVSTNTLYVLSCEQLKSALSHLSRITKPNGTIIVELPLKDDFEISVEKLHHDFINIRIIYYRNFVSSLYESVFERNGFLGSHPIAGTKPFLVLSWLLSRIEYLTCYFRILNKHALIIANKKRGNKDSAPFDLSHIPHTQEGDAHIFDVLPSLMKHDLLDISESK